MNYKGTSAPPAVAQLLALYNLISTRWDPLFEREDANGVRTSRGTARPAARLCDDDEHSTTLRAAFGATHCSFLPTPHR
jgi:hypothetical protein